MKVIKSLNAQYQRVISAKGHFPTEQATLKEYCTIVTQFLATKGIGQARWTMQWKPVFNALAVNLFVDRMSAAEDLSR